MGVRTATEKGEPTKIDERHKAQASHDRDEYPPAVALEGGDGASVRYIDPSDNRSAGACLGQVCKKLKAGARILTELVD